MESKDVSRSTTQVSFEDGKSSNEEMIGFNLGILRNDINFPMYPWINTTVTKHQTNAITVVELCLIICRLTSPAEKKYKCLIYHVKVNFECNKFQLHWVINTP